jgi:ubiquinone/menaquinone biosynthesis C-methylase UbiE
MLALLMGDLGRLNERTEVLAVGAGDERIAFWLANRVGRMVVSDIYGEGSFSDREAEASMLADPAAHAPFPYREERLEVRRADARELPYPDDAFDGAYLVTVLGEVPDQDAALRELRRVLKPEGRVVVGELFGDPHMVTHAALRERAAAAGLQVERVLGGRLWHFTRLAPA